MLVRQLLPGLPAAERQATAEVFDRHMQRLSLLDDPGTLPVREYATTEAGPFYFVTDVPVGITLGELVLATGSMPVPTAAALGLAIASRLVHAHERGVHHLGLHRGVVLIDPHGGVTVLDLGLVPLLLERVDGRLRGVHTAWDFLFPDSGAVAPELLAGEETSSATDVYGLGTLLYLMMTAVLPHTGSSVVAYNAILSSRDGVDPRKDMPDLAPQFADLVARCLRRAPFERPSFDELIQGLSAHAETLEEALAPYRPVLHSRRYVERFEPLLRVVDGGRGLGPSEPDEPPSPGVVPLFREPNATMSEAELLAHMSVEQRGIYLAGTRGRGGDSRRQQLRRGALLGVIIAIVVWLYLAPSLGPTVGTPRYRATAPPPPAPTQTVAPASRRAAEPESRAPMYRRDRER